MQDFTTIVTEEKPAEQTAQTEKPKKDPKKEILSWIVTIAAAVAIALLIRTFLFEPVRVDGHSMDDTLANGEIMFVTKPEYLFGEPQRGDIVICKFPDRGGTLFVKRLIGLPGDTVEVKSNVVYVNGEAIDQSYLTPDRNDDGRSMSAVTLSDEQYFVMGDNRDNSHDSRASDVGPLTRSQIIGHVRCVLFPFNKIRGVQ